MRNDHATERRPDWRLWAALMAGLYLAASFVGLSRTLIGTEVWALYYALRPLGDQMEAIRLDLVHPPLMYLVERGWMWVFGSSDTAVKMLPLVINIPSLILFTWLARQAADRWRLGAFLFTGSYLTVGSANTLVRMYGLVILWTLISIAIWEKWRQKPTGRLLAAWTMVMVLLVYTHYFGMLMLAAFLPVNWLFGPRRWSFTIAAGVAGLSFIPWLAYVLPVYESRGLDSNLWWVHMLLPRAYEGIALLLSEYLGGIPGPKNFRIALIAVAAALHLLLLVSAWRSVRRLWPPVRNAGEQRRWFWVVASLAGVPVLLLYAFSIVYTPAFASRFVLGILPAYWLLMTLLSELGGRWGARLIYGAVLPWVLISAGISLVTSLLPSPVLERTRAIAAEFQPDDLVISERDQSNSLYWEIAHRRGRDVRFEVLPKKRSDGPKSTPERLGEEQGERLSVFPYRDLSQIDLQGVRRVWVLYSSKDVPGSVAAFLTPRGFVAERTEGAEAPFLTLFVKQGAD